MIAVLWGSFVFSLVSSLHCALMCGPIKATLLRSQFEGILYHVGRAISYFVLAYLVHRYALSHVMKLQDDYKHLFFVILVAVVLIGFLLGRSQKFKSKFTQFSLKLWDQNIRQITGQARGFILGLLTGLIPCGVLYSFIISISFIEDIKLRFLSVLIFVFISALGINFSSYGIQKLRKRFLYNNKIIYFSLICLSVLLMTHRLYFEQLKGFCFS